MSFESKYLLMGSRQLLVINSYLGDLGERSVHEWPRESAASQYSVEILIREPGHETSLGTS
jgi:hypothetical protein